eukprot:15340841-Ditylum_brightwellii.AAC.2
MEQPPPAALPPTVASMYQKLPKANMEAVKAHRIIYASPENAASPETENVDTSPTTRTAPFKTIEMNLLALC